MKIIRGVHLSPSAGTGAAPKPALALHTAEKLPGGSITTAASQHEALQAGWQSALGPRVNARKKQDEYYTACAGKKTSHPLLLELL